MDNNRDIEINILKHIKKYLIYHKIPCEIIKIIQKYMKQILYDDKIDRIFYRLNKKKYYPINKIQIKKIIDLLLSYENIILNTHFKLYFGHYSSFILDKFGAFSLYFRVPYGLKESKIRYTIIYLIRSMYEFNKNIIIETKLTKKYNAQIIKMINIISKKM